MTMARIVLRICALAIALTATAASLSAHGGQFRGPWSSPPLPPSTGGPGGPAGPAPGPTTGGRPTITDGTSWQVWWEFNKEDLMAATATQPPAAPVSGSDEFFLGPRRHEPRAHDSLAPTETDRHDRIAVELAAALRSSDNNDLVTSCLVGLGKVGIDPGSKKLPELFAPYLASGDQEVRETATLALGIAGRQSAFATLSALLLGNSQGKVLSGGKDKEVPERTRTFAAWSLGLMAGRSHDPALKRAVSELLLARLGDDNERSRDLRVGLIEGLGLLMPEGERTGGEKLLLWQVTQQLWHYYARDLGKGDQLVQAHVPVAVGHLLQRGNTPEHQRSKALLVEELTADGRSNQIRQSAALTLGALCLPTEQFAGDAEFAAALARGYRKCNDQLTRFFCVLALGRIGGDANRALLLDIYLQANKAIEKPWAALALGLIARDRARTTGVVDQEVGRLLHRDLDAIEFEDARAGIALALGMCGYRDAAQSMVTLLRDGTRNETLLGYLAVSLALLGHTEIADDLVALMQKSVRKPFLLQQCAVALGRLGDARTVPTLLTMLDECQSTAALSAVANALAQIRDRRSIDPLIAALHDPVRTSLARAFAAAALGGVGDKDALPWNTLIARDMNYMATVDTLVNGSTGVLDIL